MANPADARRVDMMEEADGSRRGAPEGVRTTMRKDKLLILAVFAAVVGAAVGIQQFHRPQPTAPLAPAPAGVPAAAPMPPGPASRPVDVAQIRGFSLQLQSAASNRHYEQYVGEIAATGANAVCLVVAAYQENCASTSIFVESRRTPPDERVKKIVAHARKLGLRVLFMPIVLLENPRSGEWRGKINPANCDE